MTIDIKKLLQMKNLTLSFIIEVMKQERGLQELALMYIGADKLLEAFKKATPEEKNTFNKSLDPHGRTWIIQNIPIDEMPEDLFELIQNDGGNPEFPPEHEE